MQAKTNNKTVINLILSDLRNFHKKKMCIWLKYTVEATAS
jgi:hypothetical protein